jgi:CubicO group peptidase (beta-lactamase class C family)
MKQLLIISFLLISYFSYGQTIRKLDNFTMGEIDAVINAEISQSNLPSVSVGIIYNGRVVYTKAYGISAPGVNASVSTKYPIASISKTITGILAMRMVQNGDFALDDPISNYVSGFNGITFRHLLSHQSGIGHYNNCGGGYYGAFNAANSILTVLGCTKCMTPPGSGTIYTTFGSTLLGSIIDLVGQTNYNKSYVQLYNDWIKTPGGLNDLTAEHDNLINGIAIGYSSGGTAQTGYWNDIGWKLPAGGFVSTGHDLAEYGAGVMNHTFISSTNSLRMWTRQTTTGTPNNQCNDALEIAYGLAFDVSGTGDNLRISHSGENTDHGFCSLLTLFPNRKTGIVLLTNKANRNGALNDILQALQNTLLCPANREFTSNINWTGNWIYEGNNIKASNTFSAGLGEIVFDGATEVLLRPGFHAQAGQVFRAIIDGCAGSINPY